jgi:thymidine kinase
MNAAMPSRIVEPEDIEVHNRSERPELARRSAGWIEVIAGSMFSGKSEELIRRLRRAKIARQKIQVFKPEIDQRFSNDHIVSHSEIRHESANVQTSEDIRARIEPDTEVVGIDEAQFFDNELIAIANGLAERGVRVIIAGLDQDYTGKPWEPMPQLLAIAEYITKTHAICVKCGQPANYSQRIFESEERVAVGATGMYEARCRQCFVPHADAPTIHPD